MCNPRRVRVRATRELAEAWNQEVRRQVTRTGQAVAEARVREPLESTVGGPTLAALEAVLARTEGWQQDPDGVFRHELHGGHIAFDPASRELELLARESSEITATGEASIVVRTEASGTVEGEGVGTYYDDNWADITREDATRAAEQDLARSLAAAAEQRREQVRRATDDEAGGQVWQQAARRADAELGAASAARSAELQRRATDRLVAVGIEGRNLFHLALAEAYRDAILAYARTRRADNIRCTEDGGTVEIEFELQV
jgi:hypothetical protein